ncbi:hypothetical protein MT391_20700, partial [Vibrio sp. 1-Bac 57]
KNLQAIKQILQDYAEQNQNEINSCIKSLQQSQKQLDINYKGSFSKLEKEAKKSIDSVTNYRVSKTLKFSGAILSIMLVFTAGMSGISWKMGEDIIAQQAVIQELESKGGNLQITTCGDQNQLCIKIDLEQTTYGTDGVYPWMVPEGY